MTVSPAAFAQAASALVGAPFRLRGRDPATGLDCIGLVAAALDRCGAPTRDLPRYELRNTDIDKLLHLLPESGFSAAEGELATGDLLLTRPAAAQHHLAIAIDGDRFVHAHAGLGRVVATPAPLAWPAIARWRLT